MRIKGYMFALVRALTYASIFIAFVLVFFPARILEWSGVTRPAAFGFEQFAGGVIVIAGGALAIWCVVTFGITGKGTPAPFDPPRRLVVTGPYRFVRNPMYIGAGCALLGAALFYNSLPLFIYTVLFFLIAHLFVILYEEPILRRFFGKEYEEYCRRVRRWWPGGG
jgi:protein-S-isoprenylcysteine O-methyltransferase Ste14